LGKKKETTWSDIENTMRNIEPGTSLEQDKDKLEYFRQKILGHLDNLQAEEDKNVIPFPEKSKNDH
jgi:hypothetical protein